MCCGDLAITTFAVGVLKVLASDPFIQKGCLFVARVTGGELFEDIVAREFYSEADAR
jgi:hypothetical protein